MKSQILIGACCIALVLSVALAAYANRGSGRKSTKFFTTQQTEQPTTENPQRGDGRKE